MQITRETLSKYHFLVVGFGKRTGLATANYLLKYNARVSISDNREEHHFDDILKQLEGKPLNLFFGPQTIDQLHNVDILVLSPGVPNAIPLIQKARETGMPVLTEIEFASLLCPSSNLIGITGTDGKSTTTTLVFEILKNQYDCYIGGNIGIPFISFVDELNKDSIVVLELSSFQLEYNRFFHPKVACLLNTALDHQDRYDSLHDYIYAKANIFKQQNSKDVAVLNREDESYTSLKTNINSKILTFSSLSSRADAILEKDSLVFKKEKIISINDCYLKGIHNIENMLAAISITKSMGIATRYLKQTLQEFKGLPHRMEWAGNINGIDFINDSKATTVHAVQKAVESLGDPVVLLLGGRDKGLDFSLLNPVLINRVKEIICFGEAAGIIQKQLDHRLPTKLAKNLKEAIYQAYKDASQGDSILLSPACTSFDEFQNYEERGQIFKQIVADLGEAAL